MKRINEIIRRWDMYTMGLYNDDGLYKAWFA